MSCFVTVGSTRFDALSNAMLRDEVLSALKSIGVQSMTLQIGAGEFDKSNFDKVFGENCDKDKGSIKNYQGIDIEFYRYKDSIHEDMKKAKVVIGHAGAGTVLECMKMKKPLIVVINETLADNHQMELATELAKMDHLLYCYPNAIAEQLSSSKLFSLAPFVPPDMKRVARYIDARMGIQA